MINSDCKSLASDEDFLKLRKKMAAEDDEDEMIALAKKLFKIKVFFGRSGKEFECIIFERPR